jgi:hypothetical protein
MSIKVTNKTRIEAASILAITNDNVSLSNFKEPVSTVDLKH